MGILLFNLAGYRLLSGFLQQRADVQLQSRVDRRQYDLSQLISVRVPVTHLSYYNNSPEFERVDGRIEIEGVPCEYVERRIFNDSVEYLCLPNQAALKIRVSGDDYLKLVNDTLPDSKPGVQKSFVGDPYMVTESFHFSALSFAAGVLSAFCLPSLTAVALSVDERPPVCMA